MIDLSNQTHLPRTNPTQIIFLHSVHEIVILLKTQINRNVFKGTLPYKMITSILVTS